MGRLKNAPTRLKAAPPRLGYAPDDKVGRRAERMKAKPWRKWYHTPKWFELREFVFKRDRYICQYEGTLCIGKHPASDAPVAHHVKAHNGDPVLFWDPNNIVTTSKGYHDSKLQSEERTLSN